MSVSLGDAGVSPAEASQEAETIEVAAMPRIVLFDFDGVLIRGDAFYLFMRARFAASLGRKLLALLSLPWLVLLAPMPGLHAMRWLIRMALLGVGQKRYQAAANEFAAVLARRPRQFFRDGLSSLRMHQAQGDRVIVVTGCEHTLVTGILRELGLPELEVLASSLHPGWFGMRLRWHNIGKRKVQSLSEHGVAAWQVAYGDSMYDAAMLKQADEAVLVNATPALCKKMEKALGRTVSRVEWM